jgi:WD40 repeat protein/tRNA A-37 threonylcarbamoyl transferase component Bud32
MRGCLVRLDQDRRREPTTDPEVNAPDAGAVCAGATVQGSRFTILRMHAQGGLGQVSLARDERLKRQVALKEIRPEKRDNAYLRRRFLTEAEITGQLEHPGIVPIYDLDQDADGQVRYAMRFVQGRTLSDAIRDYHAGPTPLGFRELLQRFVSVCQTVAYAHSKGVIHRDLKPANVILGDYGETLVVDWGLAKRVANPSPALAPPAPSAQDTAAPGQTTDYVSERADDGPLTQAGQVLGTAAYMSPEQAAGDIEGTGPAADIYSLGAILYELLTGMPPYQGKSAAEVLAAVRRGRMVRPTQVRPRVPRALEAVCLKALAWEVPERYAIAVDVAREVEHWLADESVRAYREPPSARIGRWVRHHQKMTVGMGVLLLTGVLALGVSTFLVGQAQQETEEALRKETIARETADTQRGLAEKRKTETAKALRQTRVVSANLAFDRGLTLCDRSEVGTGLLWFVRGLELAPADEKPLRDVLRANLAAWRGHLSTLEARVEPRFGPKKARCSLWAAAFSRDGKTVLLGGAGPGIWLWDTVAGRIGDAIPHPAGVLAVAISPDGRTALTGCADGKARLWDLATRRRIGQLFTHRGAIKAVAFRPDGRAIATASHDGTAALWDLATGHPIGGPLRHGRAVLALAFRPDGKVLMTAGADGTLRRWDGASGKPAGPILRPGGWILALAWSPDCKTVLTGDSSFRAQLWDLTTNKPIEPTIMHSNMVLAVAFSPDGKTIATGTANGVNLLDLASKTPLGQPLHHQADVRSIAFAPDGKRLVTASVDLSACLWQAASARPAEVKAQLGPSIVQMSGPFVISPDGHVVAFSSLRGPVQLVDAHTGKPLGPVHHAGGPVAGLAFSSDGKKVLVGCFNKVARLYNAASWEPAGPPLSHSSPVRGVAISSNGELLVTSTQAGTLQAWDPATGMAVGKSLKCPGGWRIAISRNDKKVLTSGLGKMQLWNLTTGRLLREMRQEGEVMAVAFSPNDKRVATGGLNKVARVWDAETGQPLTPPLRHLGPVWDVAFSTDGRLLLTASGDKTARLWDVATGKRVGPILLHLYPVRQAVFGLDGQTVITVTDTAAALRTWKFPRNVEGAPKRLALWAQVLAGLELDQTGGVHVLSTATWQKRRKQLAALGGPPLP